MKKLAVIFLALSFMVMGCNTEASKKQNGYFKANGVGYNADEDHMIVDYNPNNSNLLDIVVFNGASQTYAAAIEVDVTKLNTTQAIDVTNTANNYTGANNSIYYKPINGTWIITSHKEGSPATRHTEGNFEFTAVNPYTPYDTVHVTEGHFYVNNY